MELKTWKNYVGIKKDSLPAVERLNAHAGQNYLLPSLSDLKARETEIEQMIGGGELCFVIPMKEKGPVIRPLMNFLAERAKKSVCVVNDRSDEAAVREVNSHPVSVAHRDRVLNLLDWDRLLPILNLEERPHGKGMAVLAGYLTHYLFCQYVSGKPYKWLLQHDSELLLEGERNNIEFLTWGILMAGRADGGGAPGQILPDQVRVAKFGRNNEAVMLARNSLLALRKLPNDSLPVGVRERAGELFERLSPLKWMLTGQFALRWETAMTRPFASGFLEETLLSAYLQDKSAARLQNGSGSGGGDIMQVANPIPCRGGEAANCKEYTMFQLIANFLNYLAYFVKPLNCWTLADIANFNRQYLSSPELMALIPEDEGPVYYQSVEADRIVPSIATLVENGMVNLDKGREMIRDFIKY